MTVREDLAEVGGIATTAELLARGATRHMLERLSSSGAIDRVRKGVYALPELPAAIREAARVGGRVTGLSAAAQLAERNPRNPLWVAPTHRLHVALPAHSSRLRTRTDHTRRLADRPDPYLCLHWTDTSEGTPLLPTPSQMIRDAIHCELPEIAATLIDSALYTRLLDPFEWENILEQLPATVAQQFEAVTGRCESGTETLVFWRMRQLNVALRPQVRIPQVGRVDFVIGSRLIIEVDGYRYHADPVKFEKDRQRDARLSKLGYRVLRFSYKQVMERWHEVEDAITAAIARGDHQ